MTDIIIILLVSYIGYLWTTLYIERKLSKVLQDLNDEYKRVDQYQLALIEAYKKEKAKTAELIKEMQEFHLN